MWVYINSDVSLCVMDTLRDVLYPLRETKFSPDDLSAWDCLNCADVNQLDEELARVFNFLLNEPNSDLLSVCDDEWDECKHPEVSRRERSLVCNGLTAVYNALFRSTCGGLEIERNDSHKAESRLFEFRECTTYWIVSVFQNKSFICEFGAGFMWDTAECNRWFKCDFDVGGVVRRYASFKPMIYDLCVSLKRTALADKLGIEWGLEVFEDPSDVESLCFSGDKDQTAMAVGFDELSDSSSEQSCDSSD